MSRRLAAADDPNAAISAAGLAGEDPAAEKTLELFVSLYGSAAGDLALVAKATGGDLRRRRHRADDPAQAALRRCSSSRSATRAGCRRCWRRSRCA